MFSWCFATVQLQAVQVPPLQGCDFCETRPTITSRSSVMAAALSLLRGLSHTAFAYVHSTCGAPAFSTLAVAGNALCTPQCF